MEGGEPTPNAEQTYGRNNDVEYGGRKLGLSVPRRYPTKDIKLLFGLAAARCAFPNCRVSCIEPETDEDDAAILGQIAHIEAHSDDGPRANRSLSEDERDCYNNWILLCNTHHALIDAQPNTYTVETLRSWKESHEIWVNETLRNSMRDITFAELDMITLYIIDSNPQVGTNDFTVIPPLEKLARNDLSARIGSYITMGLIQTPLVQRFLEQMAHVVPDFPERLRQGFVSEYNRLRDEVQLRGDDLFMSLLEFASGHSKDFVRQAAGLAALTYLFISCEVFEK